MKRTVILRFWLAMPWLIFTPFRAADAADAAKGEIIAKRWCASCHLVSPDQKQAVADVPSFAAVARMKLPDKSLKAFLSDPHPRMPNMSLTRAEIDDIVAYIRSLGD